jgi:hypothetical protein
MHLLLPLIDNKRGEPKMTPHLLAVVKRVAELHGAGLQACHCTEEFTLWWIHPLGHRKKLTYVWLQLSDPSHDPAANKIFNFTSCC